MKKAYVIVQGVRYEVRTESAWSRFKQWLGGLICVRGFWGRVWHR